MYEASLFQVSLDKIKSISGESRPARRLPLRHLHLLLSCCLCWLFWEWSSKAVWQITTTRMLLGSSLHYKAFSLWRPREWKYSNSFLFYLKDIESCNELSHPVFWLLEVLRANLWALVCAEFYRIHLFDT